MERGSTQGIQFIVSIILARLLLPEDYGLIAIVTILTMLANVLVQNGFNTALIQKKDADEVDFSSVFYLSMLFAGLLYAILYFAAPFIADFYGSAQLIPVLRVLSLTLFFGAFNSIQNAYIARHMMFKKLFFSSLGAVIVSGVVGIIAAYSGWGVWALVAQQLTNQALILFILWFTVKWRPRLLFSIEKVKMLFAFGWKMLASTLIDTLYRDIRSLIIGKIYNPAMLGFYNRGEQFPRYIVNSINGSIQSVMFPAISSQQDDIARVKGITRRTIVTTSFIMFPVMIGLAAVAEPVIKIFLTDKWLQAVPFLQIFCVAYSLLPIHTSNQQAINALGRSDVFLKLEIIKKTIGLIILGISIPFGIYAIAWGAFLGEAIASFVNAYPNLKLLNYSYIEQLEDIIPSLLLSVVMGAIVYTLNFLNITVWQTLIMQVAVGVIIYIGLAKMFKIESYTYIIDTLKQLVKER